MASKTAHADRAKSPPPEMDELRRDALITTFRAKLAGLASPLDRVSRQELEKSRAEFSLLPEVAGEPLPDPLITARRRKARGG
jgi:hypothetical protein